MSPTDVVRNGNRHKHALSSGLGYQDEHGRFTSETVDAPLAVLGEKSPIYFLPDLFHGIHFSLFHSG